MNRRDWLAGLGCTLTAAVSPTGHATASAEVVRLAATWRGARTDSAHRAGVLQFDRAAQSLRIAWCGPLPGRAHGLLAETDGSVLVVAVRPGNWLLRFDAAGQPAERLALDPSTARHLTGHVAASVDGRWLYTGETNPRDDSGWIGVRDRRTLQQVDQWSTNGIEPHQLLVDPRGALLVANGGIRRERNDRKRALGRMASSLVRLDATSGGLLGQWRLDDPRLSLRHMAWSDTATESAPLLGLGIQAEHDGLDARRQAPVLAIWDGEGLSVPTHAGDAEGYAGDIAAAPGGGFVLSSHRVNSAFWWHPSDPGRLRQVAQLTAAYALGRTGPNHGTDAVAIAAARGAALWHPARAATLLPWPEPMALENHWIALDTSTKRTHR